MGVSSSKQTQKEKARAKVSVQADGFRKSKEDIDQVDQQADELNQYTVQIQNLEAEISKLMNDLQVAQQTVAKLEIEKQSALNAFEETKSEIQANSKIIVPSQSSPQPVISETKMSFYENEIERLKKQIEFSQKESEKQKTENSHLIEKERKTREQAEKSLQEFIKANNEQQLSANDSLKKRLQEVLERENQLKEKLSVAEKSSSEQILRKSAVIERLELEKMLLQQEKLLAAEQLKTIGIPQLKTSRSSVSPSTTTTIPIKSSPRARTPERVHSSAIQQQRRHTVNLQQINPSITQQINSSNNEAKSALREKILQSKSTTPQSPI